MRKLFVSFTRLIRALRDGQVDQRNLDHGLYYFGCTRELFMRPLEEGESPYFWYFKRDDAEAVAVHGRIVNAVLKAEREGRAIFRSSEGRNTYAQLNGLLAQNGFIRIPTDDVWHEYSYSGVEDLINEAGIQLSVVR